MASFIPIGVIVGLICITTIGVSGDATGADVCEDIIVPMCRGLVSYNRTRLPNQFGHTTQNEVYRSLQQLWSFMDMGCSANFRLLACGYYLPKCTDDSTVVHLPCKGTCNRAKRKCAKEMRRLGSRWPREFRCNRLKLGRTGECLVPVQELDPATIPRHSYCIENRMPMCQNLLFNAGSLPNMFLQRTQDEIQAEMEQYRPLVDSGCSENLKFFLCGTYMPYCVRSLQNPYALPCRELCESVKEECEADYRLLYGNLPWSVKFQCHRFPLSTNTQRVCVVPTDLQLIPRRRQYQLAEAAARLDGLADRIFMVETGEEEGNGETDTGTEP